MSREWLLVVLACGTLVSAAPVHSKPATPAIVFERGGELYAIAIDGSRTVRLTKTRMAERKPAVSPDSSTIAFSRGIGIGAGIWTMNVDGSRRRIVSRVGDHPAWSPDGRTIYFVRYWAPTRYAASCGSIARVPASGGRVQAVTRRKWPYSHLDPAVSPDGQRIAFSDWRGCEGGFASPRLRVVDASGRPTGDLTIRRNDYAPSTEHSNPAWSPDSERLAFIRNGYLTAANRDGSGERRLARGGGYDSPAWSADGSWIAFPSGRCLSIVRPDGMGLRRLGRTVKDLNCVVGGWLPRLPS